MWLFSKERRCLSATKNISSSFWPFYFHRLSGVLEYGLVSQMSSSQLCHQKSDHLQEIDTSYFENSKAKMSSDHIGCYLERLVLEATSLLGYSLTTRSFDTLISWLGRVEDLVVNVPSSWEESLLLFLWKANSLVRLFSNISSFGIKSHALCNL